MFASLVRRIYRLLTLLYPTEFRREHGNDMALLFDDLVADRGILAATSRTSIDLIVTVPRYRLEAVMSESNATQVLTAGIAGLLILGFASVGVGLPWAAPVLILAGLGLALANRGRLARSIRTPDPSRRKRLLRRSALSAVIFVACVVGFIVVTWDGEASTPGLLIPSLMGTFAMFGAVGFLVAALLMPRTEVYPGAP
ncbi:MAG: hypothetical protein WD557_02880 [Dehalococcoidia bacterium]